MPSLSYTSMKQGYLNC